MTAGLAALARDGGTAALVAAADRRTRELVDGFVHDAGPPQARFAWVALGSHARGELHCASDQDHALIWQTDRAAASSYAHDLAAQVIDGLDALGMRRCDGGYMADRWSLSLARWIEEAHARVDAPTPTAVVETEVFLDVRPLAGDLDLTPAAEVLAAGADSPRLLHGLASAAVGFATPLGAFGRLPHGPVDLKRGGLAPIVLLARLYALRAGTNALGTVDRLTAAAALVGEELAGRLVRAFSLLSDLRLAHQLQQAEAGQPLSDRIQLGGLGVNLQHEVRDAFRAVKAAQSVTALQFRTDL